MRKKKKVVRRIEPYLYLLPGLIVIIAFIYSPFVKTIVGSTYKVDMFGQLKEFCGLDNYVKPFTNESFYKALGQTFLHTVIFVPFSILIGFVLALIADKKSRFHRVYEVLFCLSMTVSISIACQIFRMMYNPSYGMIKKIFGISVEWLTDSQFAMLAITIITIWVNIGFNYIYLSAAIKNVPDDVMESAEIDGANYFTKVRKFILPLISPSMFYLIVTSIITGLTMITPVLILTKGGPSKATETLLYSMYTYAYTNSNYGTAYAYGMVDMGRYMINSLVIALLGTAGRVITSTLAAFAFSYYEFRGKNLIFMLFMGSMMVPGDVLIFSNYLTVSNMGLMNSYIGIVIIYLVYANYIFMLRQHMMSLPQSLYEAAIVDGCSNFRYFLQIIVPLSKSIIVAVFLSSFVGLWNIYLWPLIVTNDESMRTIQVGVSMLSTADQTSWGPIMAATLIALLPTVVIFSICQKQIVRGMTAGAVKG